MTLLPTAISHTPPLVSMHPSPHCITFSCNAPLLPTQQSTWPFLPTLALPHLQVCLSQHHLPSSKMTPLLLAHWPFHPLYRVLQCPGLITMNMFQHFTPLSQSVPLDLVLHLPLRLTLHPPDFVVPYLQGSDPTGTSPKLIASTGLTM